MKKNILSIMMLGLGMASFAADAPVEASVNLIKAIEIEAVTNQTQQSIINTFTGLVNFPDIDLITRGNPGTAVELTTPQNITLSSGGGDSVTVDLTFESGTVTTNGAEAKTIQIIESTGNVKNKLKLSTNVAAALTAGEYTGTAMITAIYN